MKKRMFLCWLKAVLVLSFVFSLALTAAAQNYYPAEVGNTWVLENADIEERRTYSLEGPETVNGTEVITLKIEIEELSTGDVVDTDKYFLTVGTEDIKLHGTVLQEADIGVVTADFPTPATFFPLNLALGDKWQIVAEAEIKSNFGLTIGGKSTTNLEVVGFEDLETPAGTFQNCAKVELALTFSAGGFINVDSTTYQWLAPDIGPVQYQNSDGLHFRLTSTNLPLAPEESDTNVRQPAPQILAFTIGDPTETSPDSGAPRGTVTLYGYSPEITSPPTTFVSFQVKRENDTEWIEVGTATQSIRVTTATDAKLAAASVARPTGNNLVPPSNAYQKWMLQVDTTWLPDTITADNPGARDYTLDVNQYTVRAIAIAAANGSETLSADSVSTMFSVDNVDDVAPLGPTNVSLTSVDAIDSVLETAEDGSYTVGGLVDKYDEAVPSPVATFTLEPTADRKTYTSVKFLTDIENLVIGEVTETEEGSGVFTVTVDVGTLADGMTYLENGTYMFHALAFDEFDNVQEDMSETDGSKISVAVENSYRPDPELSPYDVNADGVVNILDLTFVAARLGEMDSEADVNGDGIVNILDLVSIANNLSN